MEKFTKILSEVALKCVPHGDPFIDINYDCDAEKFNATVGARCGNRWDNDGRELTTPKIIEKLFSDGWTMWEAGKHEYNAIRELENVCWISGPNSNDVMSAVLYSDSLDVLMEKIIEILNIWNKLKK